MSRPFKGVIVPLESFIEPVRASVKAPMTHELYLIKKLMEDQFLLDVRFRRHNRTAYVYEQMQVKYRELLKRSVPDYEILFGNCFHNLKMRMWYFPDIVYIEQLDDSLIVTWKRE